MSKAAIEAGARACEKYLGNRADLAAPINHEDLSAAIVIAFLRALLAEGPSEGMIEEGRHEDGRATAYAVWQAMLTQLITELEGK